MNLARIPPSPPILAALPKDQVVLRSLSLDEGSAIPAARDGAARFFLDGQFGVVGVSQCVNEFARPGAGKFAMLVLAGRCRPGGSNAEGGNHGGILR